LTNLFSGHYKGWVNWMSQCSFFWMKARVLSLRYTLCEELNRALNAKSDPAR